MELGDRVKQRRAELKLSQIELCKRAGIKQPSLSAIENNTAKNIRASTLKGLAKGLEVSEQWLETGKESSIHDANAEILAPQPYTVPLIDAVAAGDWTETTDPYSVGDGYEMMPCAYDHGPNAFALNVRGESMLPEFPEGLIIYIDPSVMPENGQYCVAKLSDTNEATFKQFVIEDGKKYLKATNPDWPEKYIPINGNCHIVGKMIGIYKKY